LAANASPVSANGIAERHFPALCILVNATFNERSWGEAPATPSPEWGVILTLIVTD
jgi:hypothetical protein